MTDETKYVEDAFDLLQDFATETKDGDNVTFTSSYERLSTFFRHQHRLLSSSPAGLKEALEELLAAIPKQDNDYDWWGDDLLKAVVNARKALSQPIEANDGRVVRFYIDEIHDMVKQYNKKEISIYKLTELLNDKLEENGLLKQDR